VRCSLGEAAHIPYPDQRFDKAFAVHVIYFWPQPQQELREIRRVLRPGGLLVLGHRPKDDPSVVARAHPLVYELRSVAEVEKLARLL
jgi:ubiquinone/menaquinone biosynthesis C-methylase UbiE